ncbi:MAG: hypothetical protein JW700_02790 [Candidatus Aenigmarchaeota archaeon]|nr:hypothetical protein [Candidatus Aenigmarchaeota archaeon]
MEKDFVCKINESSSIPDIFEMVKEAVWKSLRRSRAGLTLGLVDMGNHEHGFVGGYYVTGSNMIVMNESPLKRIQETEPKLLNAYVFHVLLHEYLHSLGIYEERDVKDLTYEISREIFGERNVVTAISKDINKFFPNLIYPDGAPNIDAPVRFVPDFDRSCTRYIG